MPDEETKQELRKAIQDLTEHNILIQGVTPRCPRCSFLNWYDLGEIRKEITCRGCHATLTFPAEAEWQYRLNELISKTMISQGVLPAIICIAQLLHDSRHSFIYVPSIELYKTYEDKNPAAELDIICISDGKFIIGEAKKTGKLYGQEDTDRLEKLAKQLNPDQVIVYALEEPYEKAEKTAQDLSERLKSKNIQARFVRPWHDFKQPSYSLNPF